VVAVRGQVEANNQMLVAGQTLAERDKINTGDDGFVTIKLADGSTLTIQSKSSVELERTRQLANTTVGESVVRLERGRLETAVTKQNAAAKYEVRTPTSNMGVRGTMFRAGTDESGKKLFTIEHKPTFLNKADSNVVARVANEILADSSAKLDDLKN
jgi:hypothetical protein